MSYIYDIYIFMTFMIYIFNLYKKICKILSLKIFLRTNSKSNIDHLSILKKLQEKKKLIINQLKNHRIYEMQ